MSYPTSRLFVRSFSVGVCVLLAFAATSAKAVPPRARAHVNRVQAKTVHKTKVHHAKAVHKTKVRHAVPHHYSKGLRFTLSLPSGYATVSLGGVNYYRHAGVYYRRHWHDSRWVYRVVPTPTGLYVPTLPPSPYRVVINGRVYYRSGSTFYMATIPQSISSTAVVAEPAPQAVEQKYIVAQPPIGATVDELPPGALEYQLNGTTYYVAGESHYLPIQIGDVKKYVVVDPPKADMGN